MSHTHSYANSYRFRYIYFFHFLPPQISPLQTKYPPPPAYSNGARLNTDRDDIYVRIRGDEP